MTRNSNLFDVKKHKCALCGFSGHSFDDCPKVTQSYLKSAYICLCLLTFITATNSALANPVDAGTLHKLQANILYNNQLLAQQQESINFLTQASCGMDQTFFGIHIIVITSFN